MTDTDHTTRVRNELIAAGVTGYGLQKASSRYLPKIIHKNEHIGGVVYGRHEEGSAMLIATDKRVIFLDKKPLFTTNDEVAYDVVAGIKIDLRGVFSSITLHTRVTDYTLRYVNRKCANTFKRYIESRRLEMSNGDNKKAATTSSKDMPFLTEEAANFMAKNEVAVLSTVDKRGVVDGAVVYYILDEKNRLYILTKADTKKAQNIISHKQVAVTISDIEKGRTLQINGHAKVETDEKIKQYVFKQIAKPRKYNNNFHLPPVAWLDAGMFVIIRITPQTANYSDYTKKDK